METEHQQFEGRIRPEAFNAAVKLPRIRPEAFNAAVTLPRIRQRLCRATERTSLIQVLKSITPGGENTDEVLKSITPGEENSLLHLAASVGNLPFVEELLERNPLLVKAINAENDTALHLAAQGGFSKVVEILLQQQQNGVDVLNKRKETALFKAYESGNLDTVKALFEAHPLSILEGTANKRTCLTVAINRGDSDLVDHILESPYAKQLIQERDELGSTALHIAVRRNYVDIIEKLIKVEAELCYWVNGSQETPLFVAAKLGHLEAVQELIKWRPDAVDIRNSCGMNVLHMAAQVSQVRIVDHLNKTVGLSYLVNKGLDKPPEQEQLRSGGKTDQGGKKDLFSEIHEGDTALHIAARKKNLNMINSLLRIRGINKFAVNKEGLTALDIVRENTEYHESDEIIAKLGHYPSKHKTFLYSAPKVSAQKYENSINMVNKTYDDRRNTELVVAVLLATMSFTAAFTVPGSFVTDDVNGNVDSKIGSPTSAGLGSNKSLGSPILLGLDSFKLFLIFDCVAFFLSLFVVLMWQMSTPITTGNKILFVCTTNLLVCATFAFTTYGFMAAVYAMLDRDAHKLAWFILGACLIICSCGNFCFFYMAAKFSVKKARFNHLNGLVPFVPDRVGEWVWTQLEKWGLLDWLRWCISKWVDIFYWDKHDDKADNDKAEKDTTQKNMSPINEFKALSVIQKV